MSSSRNVTSINYVKPTPQERSDMNVAACKTTLDRLEWYQNGRLPTGIHTYRDHDAFCRYIHQALSVCFHDSTTNMVWSRCEAQEHVPTAALASALGKD